MAELPPLTPCDGLLPVETGGLRLTEVTPGHLTSLMPGPDGAAALGKALETAHGLGWPDPGRAVLGADAAVVWTGHDQAMLMGPVPDASLAEHAALTDQSDAWAVVTLSGADGPEALARLVPVDLRPSAFPEGFAARTLLGHMNVSLVRTGPEAIRIMAFRSMAQTLVHELRQAMEGIAARRAG
ncbi:sarcosine oxidase subunit gamma [Rhodosalinus sp. FB01]|uniref:sarcosine oxidase subunit gamma n=1 Tax=Rhodosalinus sp. FB01 TaxID=3239194 RepID=UPI003524F938